MFVTIDEAKDYLRVDTSDDDELILGLIASAERLCGDIARLSDEDLQCNARDEKSLRIREIMRIAVLYAVGYLYEHREDADHHELILTLRSLLFAIREGVF